MIVSTVRFERIMLFGYFLGLIVLGTFFLVLPFSWSEPGSVGFLNALFTSVSAVCVTGLITVDTALYTTFGQTVIILLIQLGGLGIITFTTIFLLQPLRRISIRNAQVVQKFSIATVAHDPKDIIRYIAIFTFVIEFFGVIFILPTFIRNGVANPIFSSIFHSVSAFSNAGFSTFSTGLERFQGQRYILSVFMVLIVLGGIGFLVLIDIRGAILSKVRRRHLALHTKIVLTATVALILLGAFAYTLAGLSITDAFFQSVTTRTAGFNSVPQSELSNFALMVTYPLMFIGGAPGSTAGGVKVTTFFLGFIALFKGFDQKHQLQVFGRSISLSTMQRVMNVIFKTFGFVFVIILLLSAVERTIPLKDIMFEVFSAMGTVGLSRGVTPQLSSLGKILIMITMFAGRVGIVSLTLLPPTPKKQSVYYPNEEVMIG